MNCRHCGAELVLPLIDLGSAPPSNAYLTEETMHTVEKWFPLRVLVCETCWLVQTEDFNQADELFDSEYSYFSSFSTSWLVHCKDYVDDMVSRFDLNEKSLVVELAANDGYLLQFVKGCSIPCIGIEPTASTAAVAREKGIRIIEDFFCEQLAQQLIDQGKAADLIVANNVLAHVPDINGFVSGCKILLKSNGVSTFEFPHLLKLIQKNQFDTIYHEHFSYLSLTTVISILKKYGLQVFDVEEISTHGGSLRVFAQHSDTGTQFVSEQVINIHNQEMESGINNVEFYNGFQIKADKVKNNLLKFLIDAKNNNKNVAAYGAAAKGNTLLNYAGVKHDLLAFVVDKNPSKQGKYMPGSRIPIKSDRFIIDNKLDYVVILPWNLKNEIVEQLSFVSEYGGEFVTFIPEIEIV